MNITINTKVVAIAGGTVALAVAIGGGVMAYNKHKAAEAHAQRPIVENACVMNGYGEGHCNFTNVGKTAGAVCGNIQVDGPGTVYSNKFCSGVVQSMTTEKVEFSVPDVNELCENGFESWTKKCSFNFVES
jgi:hypothetical protein